MWYQTIQNMLSGTNGGLDLSTVRKKVDALEFRRQEAERRKNISQDKNPISQIEQGHATLPPCGKLQIPPRSSWEHKSLEGCSMSKVFIKDLQCPQVSSAGGNRALNSAWPLLPHHLSMVAQEQREFPQIWPSHWRY